MKIVFEITESEVSFVGFDLPAFFTGFAFLFITKSAALKKYYAKYYVVLSFIEKSTGTSKIKNP